MDINRLPLLFGSKHHCHNNLLLVLFGTVQDLRSQYYFQVYYLMMS